MTRRLFIASRSNERLKAVRRLARKRSRDVVIVEGARALRGALDAGVDIREVYAAPELFLRAEDARLLERCPRIVELSRDAFLSISGNARADGLLALVARPSTALARLSRSPDTLIVVAERIERPGNLGTIVRTACAAGADGLVACGTSTDVFHRDVVRGAVGTMFALPVAEAATPDAIAWLRERGIRIAVATPEAPTPYWTLTRGCAIVVGNERYGVGEAWRAAADELVSIPMAAPADSVNVAVAAGVLLFAAAQQGARRDAGLRS